MKQSRAATIAQIIGVLLFSFGLAVFGWHRHTAQSSTASPPASQNTPGSTPSSPATPSLSAGGGNTATSVIQLPTSLDPSTPTAPDGQPLPAVTSALPSAAATTTEAAPAGAATSVTLTGTTTATPSADSSTTVPSQLQLLQRLTDFVSVYFTISSDQPQSAWAAKVRPFVTAEFAKNLTLPPMPTGSSTVAHVGTLDNVPADIQPAYAIFHTPVLLQSADPSSASQVTPITPIITLVKRNNEWLVADIVY